MPAVSLPTVCAATDSASAITSARSAAHRSMTTLGDGLSVAPPLHYRS